MGLFNGQMKYKLSKCQSLQGHALDQRTTKKGGVRRTLGSEQPPVSLLRASCPPLGGNGRVGGPSQGPSQMGG